MSIKKPKDTNLEQQAAQTLMSCLNQVPTIKIVELEKQKTQESYHFDFWLRVAVGDYIKTLIVELKSSGQPKIVREAINQMMRYKEINPQAYLIFMAPYISPAAAQLCEKEGVGCIDLAGNCSLSLGSIYIKQEGKPNPFSEKRELRSLYSPKASRVLRVLLENPKKIWKLQDLAQEAKVSLGQASAVKKLLSDREWILIQDKRKRYSEFFLKEPQKLLTEWTGYYSYRSNKVLECYSLKNLADFENDAARVLSEKKIPYAFTGFSAAARFAPMVRYQRLMIFVEAENQAEVLNLLELKEVTSGANVSLFIPYDSGVFYGAKEIDDVKIVSPIQAYLDLISFRGRGEEAAQELLEREIKKSW